MIYYMPGLVFAKDTASGCYIACNQAYAEYVHKDNPEAVIGLTDFDLHDAASAVAFLSHDRETLAMDEPNVYYEDILTVDGQKRRLQTTKMKYVDEQDRLCIMGILCEEGEGCNQSVLYKNSGLGKTTINSAIRRMEQQNLLYLTPGEGRNTCVYLTDAGREMLRTSVEPVIRIENEIYSSWTKKEQELFVGLNQRYLDMFREKTDHIGREKSK